MTEKTLTRKGSRIRRRMIDTTARILREQGFRGATVRRIAGEAHVNISSVRYYFGSKEQLIALAMDTLMGDVESVVSCLDDTRVPAKERLRRYMRAYIPLARNHPSLYRLLTSSAAPAHDTYFLYLTFLYEQCWPKFTAAVAEAYGLADGDDIELRSLQLISALEFPILLELNKGGPTSSAYADPANLDRYVDLLLGKEAQ